MLLDIREKVRSSKPLKYTLITIICIPFVLFGIGSYFSGRAAPPVAEINGNEVTQYQLDGAIAQQRQQLAQMFGGRIPDGFANEDMLREQALDQLITAQVVRSEVEKQKFAVSDTTLGKSIRDIALFQVDGRFDKETYENELRARGYNSASFEESQRDNTAIAQFRSGIAGTSFSLPSEQSQLDELSRQTRTIDFIRYDIESQKEAVEVTDEQVQAYFDDHKDGYEFPQRAKIEYIELSVEKLAENIDVTEEDAQTYFDENKAFYVRAEQREASHILLELDDRNDEDAVAERTTRLLDIKKRIEDGEDFAALAEEFSDDVGSAGSGGGLGVISPGQMVPEFEQAVYALGAASDISEPVVTDFGVHLVKLDKIIPEAGKSFEEVKEEVMQTIKQRDADSEYYGLRELLLELTFDNPESLEVASEETGLTIETTDWLDSETDSGPVLSNPQILATAFSDDVLNVGNNSDLIAIGDKHEIVLRVLEHEGPRPKTLDDVKDEVTDTVRTTSAGELLDEALEEHLAALKTGELVSALADANEYASATENEVLERQSTVLDRPIISEIYAQPKPTDEAPIMESATLANGDRVLYVLKSVGVAEQAEDAPQPTLVNAQLGATEYSAMLESLREKAKIELSNVSE
ncbi:MAG: SurA N-terminal domain-containing protein [Gammaproteobacteria bacterium]|nr:SurA N-terminal domain-containing protein [Gammaproteobacteria bacterium]